MKLAGKATPFRWVNSSIRISNQERLIDDGVLTRMPPRIPTRYVCYRCLSHRTYTTSPTTASPPPPPPPSSGAVKLTNRRLLAVHGTDAAHFLHGITTANVRATQTVGFYSAFLNAQGRVLNDVFIYPAAPSKAYRAGLSEKLAADSEAPGYLIEVDAGEAERLLKHLKRYKLRAKVDIRAVSEEEWSVWNTWTDDEPWTPHPPPHPTSSSSTTNPPGTVATTATDQIITCPDARAPGMGRRLLLPTSQPITSHPLNLDEPSPLITYTLRRHLRGIPEGQSEIPYAAALPQEYNIDFMGGIDFRKGCYVGQELTIRTHHTGVVRKRILPVMLYKGEQGLPQKLVYEPAGALEEVEVEAGTNIVPVGGKGRAAGKWVAGVGNVGLGLCRIEMMTDMVLTVEGSRWTAEDEFKVATVAGGDRDGKGEVRVKAFVPDWHRSKTKIRKPQQRVA